jgi:hypothetical protein
MRKLLALAVVVVAAPAFADEPYYQLTHPSRNAVLPMPDLGGLRTFGEDFESETVATPFTPSASGWTSEWDPNTSIVSPGLASSTRAARHTSDGSGINGFELNSPDFGNVIDERFVATIKIDGGGTRYDFVTQDTITLLFNTRVIFQPDGSIYGSRVNSFMTAFETFDTGETWAAGQEIEIGVEVSSSTGMVSVYKDGNLLYSELDTSAALGGTAGGIGQYLTFAENKSLAVASLDVDDVNVVPEPATLGLLALGGIALLRRRR